MTWKCLAVSALLGLAELSHYFDFRQNIEREKPELTTRFDINIFGPGEMENVPRRPGIYGFFFRFPDLSDYGVFEDSELSPKKLELIKARVIEDLRLLNKLMSLECLEIKGTNQRGSQLRKEYIGRLERVEVEFVEQLIGPLEAAEIGGFLDLLSSVSVYCTPLYVGITSKQTLTERVRQHKSNFESLSSGTFGGELAKLGVPWERVCVAVKEFSIRSNRTELLAAAEGLLHRYSSPIFGIR